jgi:ADP-heptose:LPS heptosyltransferase
VPANGRLRIGICWAGSNTHLNDRNRSIPLERFATILSLSGVDFVSLQSEVGESEAATLRQYGVNQLGQEFDDFADTAAVIAMLDLVIAVDTSVAHLAGAMAKAVAVLLPFSPDFRWLLDRADTPWYPTMRLFRQSAIHDWDGPLERVRHELAGVVRRLAKFA